MKNLIFEINKISEVLQNNNPELDLIVDFFNSNFISAINSLKAIVSSETKEIMLILYLNRDKRSSLRDELTKLALNNLKSVYININNKYYHIYDNNYIIDYINNFVFQIYPNSKYFTNLQEKFYSDIKFFSPKGKTRSAIVFDSNNGIIPVHIFNLYNKIYSIEPDIESHKNSKLNLKVNKINNVLTYNVDYVTWINRFINGDYTTPCKKNCIGNFLFSYNDYNLNFKLLIDKIKPESLIVYNKNNFEFNLDNYAITKDIASYESNIKRYKLISN